MKQWLFGNHSLLHLFTFPFILFYKVLTKTETDDEQNNIFTVRNTVEKSGGVIFSEREISSDKISSYITIKIFQVQCF